MLRYSLECFISHPLCAGVHVIIGADDADTYQNATSGLKNITFSTGGKNRKESTYNGLKNIFDIKNEDIILIHDAARPCITHHDIDNIIETLKNHRASSLAIPVSASLCKTETSNLRAETVDRDQLWALQTPQGFRYEDILNAHKNADPDTEYTDDTALVCTHNIPVKLVQGRATNIKVTYPEDLEMAEKLLHTYRRTRSGLGFDVHAFDLDQTGPLRIGGIDVEHKHPLKGHSDADVALHTITDAILGAIGEGDIGQHFPPSDDTFKDVDSRIFLEKAIELLKQKGGTLENIDLTIICEEPKIGPHAPKMRQKIAEICDCAEEQINVKATTTEQLGFTGRKEGIAAQAIATVQL